MTASLSSSAPDLKGCCVRTGGTKSTARGYKHSRAKRKQCASFIYCESPSTYAAALCASAAELSVLSLLSAACADRLHQHAARNGSALEHEEVTACEPFSRR